MATRYYTDGGTPTVTVTPDTGWTESAIPTSSGRVGRLRTAAQAKTAGTEGSGSYIEYTDNVATNILFGQYISDALSAQTISSGYFKGMVFGGESANNANMATQVCVRVVSEDGQTVRGTLISLSSAAITSEYATSVQTRKIPRGYTGSGVAYNEITLQEGDRLVVEIGTRAYNTSATAYTATMYHGWFSTSTGDLAETEGTTLSFTNGPWVEFSSTITNDDVINMNDFQAPSLLVDYLETVVGNDNIVGGKRFFADNDLMASSESLASSITTAYAGTYQVEYNPSFQIGVEFWLTTYYCHVSYMRFDTSSLSSLIPAGYSVDTILGFKPKTVTLTEPSYELIGEAYYNPNMTWIPWDNDNQWIDRTELASLTMFSTIQESAITDEVFCRWNSYKNTLNYNGVNISGPTDVLVTSNHHRLGHNISSAYSGNWIAFYGFGGEEEARTVVLDVLWYEPLQEEITADAIVINRGLKTIDADADVLGREYKPINHWASVAETFELSIDYDAEIILSEGTRNKPMPVDAVITEQGTKTYSVTGYLREPYEGGILDIAFYKTALWGHAGLTNTHSLDIPFYDGPIFAVTGAATTKTLLYSCDAEVINMEGIRNYYIVHDADVAIRRTTPPMDYDALIAYQTLMGVDYDAVIADRKYIYHDAEIIERKTTTQTVSALVVPNHTHSISVQLEMLAQGVYSLASSSEEGNRTDSSLDTGHYDGSPLYFFEIHYQSTTTGNVSLMRGTNTIVTAPVVPTITDEWKTTTVQFTPTTGSYIYTIKMPQTSSDYDIKVWSARMIVKQFNPTKTRIQIPLVSSDGSYLAPNGTSYPIGVTSEWTYTDDIYATSELSRWAKNLDNFKGLVSSNAFTFEAMISTGYYGGGYYAYCGLFNYTDNTLVTEVSTNYTYANPQLKSVSFNVDATNFHDDDLYGVRIHCTDGAGYTGETACLYKANLYITLDSLMECEVYLMTQRLNYSNEWYANNDFPFLVSQFIPSKDIIESFHEGVGDSYDMNTDHFALYEFNSPDIVGDDITFPFSYPALVTDSELAFETPKYTKLVKRSTPIQLLPKWYASLGIDTTDDAAMYAGYIVNHYKFTWKELVHDALVASTNTTTHTADAIIVYAKTITVDAIVDTIAGTEEIPMNYDGIVKDTFEETYTIDAIITERKIVTNSTATGLVVERNTSTVTADALIKYITQITVDARVVVDNTPIIEPNPLDNPQNQNKGARSHKLPGSY